MNVSGWGNNDLCQDRPGLKRTYILFLTPGDGKVAPVKARYAPPEAAFRTAVPFSREQERKVLTALGASRIDVKIDMDRLNLSCRHFAQLK